MMLEPWEQLIERYADGRPICNCRHAYYSKCGKGIIVKEDGSLEKFTDGLACEYGCSANQIYARDYIAKRVLADLDKIERE